MVLAPFLALIFACSAAADENDEWQPVRDAIDAFADVVRVCGVWQPWRVGTCVCVCMLLAAVLTSSVPFQPDTYVQIGDASGPRFAYQKGSVGADTSMPVASATKWLGNTALFVLVEEGSLSLDDPVHTHLDWWTDDPSDLRSLITLRHCMAFTTGYVGQVSCADLSSTEECARRVYEQGTHTHPPGTFFDYNSDHSRIAAAMAVAATAEPMMALIERTIFERTSPPMVGTFFANPAAPDLASTMTTTPREYEAFLSSYWSGALVSAQGRRVMESDQCPSCRACLFCQTRGHYGLGNWAGCLGWGLEGGLTRLGHWPNRCAVAEEFWSSGAFGYWPQVVRPTLSNGGLDYYFHMAMQGPGSDTAGVMKTAVQPVMDAVLRGQAALARQRALEVKRSFSRRNSSRLGRATLPPHLLNQDL
jgi:hypothetical protein